MRALITGSEVSTLGRPCNADETILNAIIAEAEREDIKPRISDGLWIALKTGTEAALADEYKLLLNGGAWTDAAGKSRYLVGIKTALAYYVSGRITRDGNIQSTRYGVRLKTDDNSAATEDTERQRQYRQLFASADGYMTEVLAYINDHRADVGVEGAAVMRSNRTKVRVVGAAGASADVVRSGAGFTRSADAIQPDLSQRVATLEASVTALRSAVAPVEFDDHTITYAGVLEAYNAGRRVIYYDEQGGTKTELIDYAEDNGAFHFVGFYGSRLLLHRLTSTAMYHNDYQL